MTLITIDRDNDRLLMILRQRLRSVNAQSAAMQAEQATANDVRQLLNAGWIDASGIEAAFLTDLIGQIERAEV